MNVIKNTQLASNERLDHRIALLFIVINYKKLTMNTCGCGEQKSWPPLATKSHNLLNYVEVRNARFWDCQHLNYVISVWNPTLTLNDPNQPYASYALVPNSKTGPIYPYPTKSSQYVVDKVPSPHYNASLGVWLSSNSLDCGAVAHPPSTSSLLCILSNLYMYMYAIFINGGHSFRLLPWDSHQTMISILEANPMVTRITHWSL